MSQNLEGPAHPGADLLSLHRGQGLVLQVYPHGNTARTRSELKTHGYGNRKEMFYLTTHSTHFIYGYMASNIWLRTILIVRKETRLPHRLLFPINSKGSFICTIPHTGLHIPRPLLNQSLSTGWNEK